MGAGKERSLRPDDFFSRIPRRSIAIFNLAVFFSFAPVGLLFVSSIDPPRAWQSIIANLIVSGLIAVSWAATFTVSRWFAVGIVITNLLMVALNTFLARSPVGIGRATPSLLGFGFVALAALGYVLFLVFILGQGKTTVRLMAEMTLARNIHDTLAPAIRFDAGHLEAIGFSSPSTEMGGDLIDLVDHGEITDLFVADVSGHGVRAGVVMGMMKSAIRMGLRSRRDLAGLLGELNTVIEETTSADLYATLVALRIDRHGRLEYGLAGHHPIAHFRAATSEVRRLGKPTFAVGMFDGRTYETATVDLEAGDLLAVYTDGLNETADASDRQIGHDPIERAIARLADRPLEEIRRSVFDLVEAHGAQTDDRTLLLVRYRGERTAA